MPQVKANGINIEYESFGRASDPALLLIMGFSAQMTMWPTALCKGLAAKGFRVIRFDNRDIGLSSHLSQFGAPNIGEAMMKAMSGQPVDAPYLLDDMAKDTVGLLDALGIQHAHIVGASMGGMIAQIVAAKYPEHTISLTSIMSTTGRRDLPQAKPEAMAALTTPPASDSREDRIAQGMKTWRVIGSPRFAATDEELRATVVAAVDRSPYDPAGIGRQLLAIMASPPRNDILKNVRAPAQVIHGEADPLVPMEGGKDTAGSIPGAKLHLVPGMAHDFTNALVPVYLRLIGDFVQGVEKVKAA
ncbi:MAG: alpha/beta hydrolase [Proteobacteria bacterium]|nr:alpha/beta hydrolase [Pseudomonadota bacterium]